MNISLTPELEKYVNDQVASGMYNSASEVMRDGLRQLIGRGGVHSSEFEGLRRDVLSGYEQAKRGDSFSLDRAALKERGLRRLAELND